VPPRCDSPLRTTEAIATRIAPRTARRSRSMVIQRAAARFGYGRLRQRRSIGRVFNQACSSRPRGQAPVPTPARALTSLSASRAGGLRPAAAPATCSPGRSARAAGTPTSTRTAIRTGRRTRRLVDPAHQVFRELRGELPRLFDDALGLAPERATCPQGVEPGSRRGKHEPSRLDPALPVAPSLRGVRNVRKTFREID
jgi:hypothetical protein